jgi:hypothetical protein
MSNTVMVKLIYHRHKPIHGEIKLIYNYEIIGERVFNFMHRFQKQRLLRLQDRSVQLRTFFIHRHLSHCSSVAP